MKYKQGGTIKWCPYCRAKTVNSVLLNGRVVRILGDKGVDPKLYERTLFCRICEKTWESCEIPAAFLQELLNHRSRLLRLEASISKVTAERDLLEHLSDSLLDLAIAQNQKDQSVLILTTDQSEVVRT